MLAPSRLAPRASMSTRSVGDQHDRVDARADRERGDGEPGDADQEDPALAVS
jgi:hypothetical protein